MTQNSCKAGDGIVLYAKASGVTSFSSLWIIKKAFSTTKIGHTGTLDNFADGLLVVMVNKMTRLVSYITELDKTYEAIIHFGYETDTLDPSGSKTSEGSVPHIEELKSVMPSFLGNTMQVPPAYSAIHVNGMRASDLIRSGTTPELAARPITITDLQLLTYEPPYAHIKVSCSKGTYIRSLARDLAARCGTCASLAALRRTRIGSFFLENAVGADTLPEFSIKNLINLADDQSGISESYSPQDMLHIKEGILEFTPAIAKNCGFQIFFLERQYEAHFFHGKPLFPAMFTPPVSDSVGVAAVFAQERFCGLVRASSKRFSYVFVAAEKV